MLILNFFPYIRFQGKGMPSPYGEKHAQPRSQKKSQIDALWVEMIRNRRVEYSVIRSFARIAHSFACYALVALLARSAALIRSLVLLLHPWRFHLNIHCRVGSLRSSICKKIVFDFFFAFASTEVPLEDRQCRVRF